MLAKIKINNCLGVSSYTFEFNNNISIINENVDLFKKVMKNLFYNKDSNENITISLLFDLNYQELINISNLLVINSNKLVLTKLQNNEEIKYLANEKEVDYKLFKSLLNTLINHSKIIKSFYNNKLNYIIDENINNSNYKELKINLKKLKDLNYQYKQELEYLNSTNIDLSTLLKEKNEIEEFDLEKGEIQYITSLYNEISNKKTNEYHNLIDKLDQNIIEIKNNLSSYDIKILNEALNDFINKYNEFKEQQNITKEDEYIISRYNDIEQFKEKYGNTYQEIRKYYDEIISKINLEKYKTINKKNLEEKISFISYKINEINNNINKERNIYINKFIQTINELVHIFDNNINFVYKDKNIHIYNQETQLNYKELLQYENFNLINLLLNCICKNSDKTIIINDDFTQLFDENKINFLNQLILNLSSCIILNEKSNSTY